MGRRSEDQEERGSPTFEDLKEPKAKIVVWTTDREDALKKVTEDMMLDEGEVTSNVLDS